MKYTVKRNPLSEARQAMAAMEQARDQVAYAKNAQEVAAITARVDIAARCALCYWLEVIAMRLTGDSDEPSSS